MEASRWKQIEALVGSSLREPAGRRAAFLEQSAQRSGITSAEIVEVCAALLAVELEQTPAWGPVAEEGPVEATPAGIEAFELIEELGAGGMGVVYRARQRGAVEREVALKLCPAQPGAQLRQRLQQERRTLARLNHPNIAQMLEAGDTAAGQPYFVMELVVGGMPINAYCDAHCMNIEQRLQVFLQVCAGVQYAHQQGVLHRDLKPANVLASGPSQSPQVKIIDFGIAKLLQAQDDDDGAITPTIAEPSELTGMAILGTPNYMSPERLQLPAAVDTRSDIYSLGVMLYELLLGQVPCARQPGEAIVDYRARRANTRALSLSAAWRQMSPQQQSQLAAMRAQANRGLAQRFAGDLQWIISRALADDPADRYASASELAADLQRHLQQRPVLAAPPSLRYRLERLLRRRRWWVLAGSTAAAALLVAFWLRGVEAERATAAAASARQAQDEAEQALRFLSDLFVAADPNQNLGRPLDAAELLQRGVDRLTEGELQDAPLVRARLLHTIAQVQWRRGEPRIGLALAEQAMALRQQAAPQDLGLRSDSLHLVGTLHSEIGGHQLAEQMLAEALQLREQVHGPGSGPVLNTLNNIGVIQEETGRHSEAVRTYQRMLDQLAPQGEARALDRARTLSNLGVALRRLARHDEAEAAHREGLAIHQRLLDPLHPAIALDWQNLGDLARARNDFSAALAHYRQAESSYRQVHGNHHPDLARTLNGIGNVYKATGEWTLAEASFQQALAIYDDEGSWAAGYPLANMALVALEQRDWPLLLQRSEAFLQRFPDQFPDMGQWLEMRCLQARAQGSDSANEQIAQALQQLGTDPQRAFERSRCLLAGLSVADRSGLVELAQGYAEQAQSLLDERPDLAWMTAELQLRQALQAAASGDLSQARELAQTMLQQRPAPLPAVHGIYREARALLGSPLLPQDSTDDR